MKTEKKARKGFKLGVIATMTAAGTIYYYMKKNNKSASDMMDDGMAVVEDVAYGANRALKDATAYTSDKAKTMFKNAKEGFEDGADKFEDGAKKVEDGFNDVAKDVKKNIDKTY
ncbi:MAG: hypothetical protein Q8S15_07345 [Erysipelotrichaceae bacterium]|nr:hypothetical protein [Erysipelotrichaceae bacterium]MDP3305869.1 hypothetical protein [Erysipelotrichaceae bacterium]